MQSAYLQIYLHKNDINGSYPSISQITFDNLYWYKMNSRKWCQQSTEPINKLFLSSKTYVPIELWTYSRTRKSVENWLKMEVSGSLKRLLFLCNFFQNAQGARKKSMQINAVATYTLCSEIRCDTTSCHNYLQSLFPSSYSVDNTWKYRNIDIPKDDVLPKV